ncbi:hypothetical protein WMY93_026213 [Mugilogobius chulae]|uniref:SRCR domain-containing protein n=1 Tax=Mugilogobius chulae TaxID=88201 RepID=A0AAW0MWT8_9GOBI
MEATSVLCRLLDCGSAVSGRLRDDVSDSPVWWIDYNCVVENSTVRDCVHKASDEFSNFPNLDVVCSESVRLVSGSSLCSGSVQIWDQSWTWLCDGALDLLGAEVLCRELGCGAPSLLQGALSPLGLQTFHCEGNESALMDCPRSSSRTCFLGSGCGLFRLPEPSNHLSVCVRRGLRARVTGGPGAVGVKVQSYMFSGATVPRRLFQLLSPAQNHTLPAVNHSAHFLFSDFGPAHQGNYTCVYHLEMFNHNFSESHSLQVFVGARNSELIFRALFSHLVLLITFLLFYFIYKVRARVQPQQ